MNEFKEVQQKDISIGGYKCKCCSPVGGRNKAREKRDIHQIARSRIKHRDRKKYTDFKN